MPHVWRTDASCAGDAEFAGSGIAEVAGISPVLPGLFCPAGVFSGGPHSYVDLFPIPTNRSKPISISNIAHLVPVACEFKTKAVDTSGRLWAHQEARAATVLRKHRDNERQRCVSALCAAAFLTMELKEGIPLVPKL